MFDWEYGIALHAMQGNRASSPSEGDASWDFSSVAGTCGIFSSYSGDGHSKVHFVHRNQDSCLVTTDTSGISARLGRIIQTLLEVRWEIKRPFLVSTEILGFLSILKKSQASSPFEALTSMSLSRCQGM